jgi:hypothetical protein
VGLGGVGQFASCDCSLPISMARADETSDVVEVEVVTDDDDDDDDDDGVKVLGVFGVFDTGGVPFLCITVTLFAALCKSSNRSVMCR